MKILSKKKIDALYDDLMVLSLIASENARKLAIGEQPDTKDLTRQLCVIIERRSHAANILKGMFGVMLANQIHINIGRERLQKEQEHEAKGKTDKTK